MSKFLDGIQESLCQSDDTLIYGKDHEEHDEKLSWVLKR